jgi:hypothetical protein
VTSAVVFLGPSLDQREAAKVLDALYLPPIKRGDLEPLEHDPPDAIGIVDGEFCPGPSVSPKEILRLMDSGVILFGASSMGALRAVELSPFGMIGVGRIYRLYQSGAVDAEDEVALLYDRDSLRPLTTPLVNMRLAVDAALTAEVISAPTGRTILNSAKRLHYSERTYERVLGVVESKIPENEIAALRQFLATSAPDAKREDAIEMLVRMEHLLRT